MIRTLAVTLAFATALVTSAPAVFATSPDQPTAEITTKIRDLLTEQGYEVRKIKQEDGLFEAYVIKDGTREEIYLDSNLEIVNRKSND